MLEQVVASLTKRTFRAGARPTVLAIRWLAALGLTVTLTHAQNPVELPEYQVTTAVIPDDEYDLGKDGVSCPTCNFSDGIDRLVFSDANLSLWVGQVDPRTGAFVPSDGHGVLLDTAAAAPTTYGNGPEWFYYSGGTGFVYTHYLPGGASDATATVGIGRMINGAWSISNLPETGRVSPDATKNPSDPDAYINYVTSPKGRWFWRKFSDLNTEHEFPPEMEALSDGNERRWIPLTHTILFQGHVPTDPFKVDQLFTYDIDTGVLEQVTKLPTGVVGCFAWHAPEFNGEVVFTTFARFRQQILVYRKLPGADGVKRWTIIKTVNGFSALPYFFSAEPFEHNGHSYIFSEISSSSEFFDKGIPNQIFMTGVNPLVIDAKLLTNSTSVYRLRLDPEYFITAQGPFIYYNRVVPETDSHPAFNDGIWRVDTGLGPPTTDTDLIH